VDSCPTKKRRREGDCDVMEREQIGKCSDSAGKLKLIESAYSKITQYRSEAGNEGSLSSLLNSKCRQFWIRTVQPIMFCLQNHCTGSHEEFFRRWGPQLKHAKWKDSHCKGISISQCSYTAEQSIDEANKLCVLVVSKQR